MTNMMNACMAVKKMVTQVTPPGYEPVVKALKKKGNIDNPWAVAWSMYGDEGGVKSTKKVKQANALDALSAVLRGNKFDTKMKCSERGAVRIIKIHEANADVGVQEGKIVEVVLITEGLGNRRNMNYYGPEAIASAPGVFEGKPCFMDHPSESEERDIPERRVRQKVGYYKNCKIATIDNVSACTAELHFDLSEDGEQAYKKACTALHYKQEFPGYDSEYVGLSINADGDVEDRTVEWQGETLQVNYVTRFRDAMSTDIVTSPARGGRFLALVESAAGAKPATKEVGPMKKDGLKKALEAARTALAEANKETDAAKLKAKVEEANKLFEAFLKEAAKAAYQDEAEDENKDGEDESDPDGDGADDGDGDSKDSHTTITHKIVKKTGKAAVPEAEDEDKDKGKDGDDDGDQTESKRLAIISMAKEAGLDLPKGKIDRLAAGSLKEAKAEIADLKWMQESIVKRAVDQIKVPVASLAKVTESDNGSGGGEVNFLKSCIR